LGAGTLAERQGMAPILPLEGAMRQRTGLLERKNE